MRRSTNWLMSLAALAALLLLGSAQPALAQSSDAQSGTSTGNSADAGTPPEDLKLTDDQKNQIKTINEQRKKDLEAVRADTSLTQEQRREKYREINKGADSQINGLLSPEQQKRYHRRQRDRREDVRDRKEDRRDRREDVRDRQHDGGRRDRIEDRADRREDKRDRREDRRDRRHKP